MRSNVQAHPNGMIEVGVMDPLLSDLEKWLDQRGLHLFKVPGVVENEETDTHYYAIGVKQDRWEAAQAGQNRAQEGR